MAQQLINEGVYRLSANGLYLTAALFGFHECDRVVLTDKTRDLNQAWRLHHVEKNGWQLINLAAEMYLSNRIGYQYDDEPFVISKVNYGGRNIFFLEEAEGGYRLRTFQGNAFLGAAVKDKPLPRNEGAVFSFELIDDGHREFPKMLRLHGDIEETGVPEMMKDGDYYYLVCDRRADSGDARVGLKRGESITHWQDYDELMHLSSPRPFPWMEKIVPNCDIWCPSISRFGGKYHMYYSITICCKNTSAMGHMTNVTLDKSSPAYCWRDEGTLMITGEKDDYNCIDAHILHTYDNEIWMVYGSSWSGIKTRRINEETGGLYDDQVYSLCYREEIPHPAEGGYLFKRNGWYYLIAAVERTDQNYRCVVGRSRDVRGPYLDKNGVDMLKEGGTTIAEHKRGLSYPGHSSVFEENGQYYLLMENSFERCATIELTISTLTFENDWPQSAAGVDVLPC